MSTARTMSAMLGALIFSASANAREIIPAGLNRIIDDFPRAPRRGRYRSGNKSGKYMPHQGHRECTRRQRQIERGLLTFK